MLAKYLKDIRKEEEEKEKPTEKPVERITSPVPKETKPMDVNQGGNEYEERQKAFVEASRDLETVLELSNLTDEELARHDITSIMMTAFLMQHKQWAEIADSLSNLSTGELAAKGMDASDVKRAQKAKAYIDEIDAALKRFPW